MRKGGLGGEVREDGFERKNSKKELELRGI